MSACLTYLPVASASPHALLRAHNSRSPPTFLHPCERPVSLALEFLLCSTHTPTPSLNWQSIRLSIGRLWVRTPSGSFQTEPKGASPRRNFWSLLCIESARDKETEGQRDTETERRRDIETKGESRVVDCAFAPWCSGSSTPRYERGGRGFESRRGVFSGRWCKGSTAGCDPAGPGSNPGHLIQPRHVQGHR